MHSATENSIKVFVYFIATCRILFNMLRQISLISYKRQTIVIEVIC